MILLPLGCDRRSSALGRAAALLAFGVMGIVAEPAAQTILREWRGINQPSTHSDLFGWTMAGVGDVDADGVPDVAVGAPWTDVGSMAYAGRLYVYSGKDGRTLFTLDGSALGAEMANYNLGAAGDMDRDGHADILVYSNISSGGFHLVSGRTGLIANSYVVNIGVVGVGDVDSDGWPDLLQGTAISAQSPPSSGLVELVSGQTGAVIYSYAGTYAYQGLRPGGRAGDVDGDGIPDLLLASWGTNLFNTYPNGIWVYSGATGGLLYRVPPTPSTGSFPAALAGVGDVNGDGFDDIASSTFSGLSHINLFAGPGGVHLPTLSSPPPQNQIADSLSAVGDIDGDGFDDVLTGGIQNGGRAVLFSGQTGSVLALITGPSPPWAGPHSTAGVGDTDGDDFPDYAYGPFPDYVLQVAVVRLYSGAPTGVTTLGRGCANSNNVIPRIGCTYVPARGQPFVVNLSRVPSGVPAILALGLSATVWNGVPLPLELSVLGAPGCYLRVAGDAVSLTATNGPAAKGRASTPVAIPNDPALVGSSFYAQWFVIDTSGPGPITSTTRALRMTVQ